MKTLVSFYMENAAIIRRELSAAGLSIYGGEHAPYVWIKTPDGMDSWGFFDHLLNKAHVVGTPGSGFGAAGEGYFRLSAFNSRSNVDAPWRASSHCEHGRGWRPFKVQKDDSITMAAATEAPRPPPGSCGSGQSTGARP